MRRRHDPFLKLLYRAGARDAVTLFFPDTAARVDWRRLQWIEKEVPIPSRPARSVVADLVGLIRDVEGRYLQVLIHPELQMQPDAVMDWRVLQYNAGHLLSVRDDWYRQLLVDAVRTYFTLNRTEQAEEQRLLRTGEYGEVNEMLHTEFGKVAANAERRALQGALMEVVRSRFPTAPEDVGARIRRVKSVARLNELIRRAATVASVEDLEL